MKKPLGIYIHIPFCLKKCNYCDFLSMEADDELKERYVAALLEEIRSYGECIDGYEAATVFFGGGTPSILKEKLILDILYEVFKWFKVRSGAEITLECNPGTLNRGKLRAYHAAGINRLSMGLQSAVTNELRVLGRVHDYEMFYRNYLNAREAGFTNINVDLMAALPGQTYESYAGTLETAASLEPEHISAYSLIIEEGTPFYDHFVKENGNGVNEICGLTLPLEEEERMMYKFTKEFLQSKGYYRYEISNYAKEGYECRHNRSYWERTEYIGAGLGASSFYMGERYKNTSSMDEYIKLSGDHRKLKREAAIVSRNDAMEEFMYLGLRLCEGVSKAGFYEQFNISLNDVYGDVIRKMNKHGYINVGQDMISLTDMGIDVSNRVLCEFLI